MVFCLLGLGCDGGVDDGGVFGYCSLCGVGVFEFDDVVVGVVECACGDAVLHFGLVVCDDCFGCGQFVEVSYDAVVAELICAG